MPGKSTAAEAARTVPSHTLIADIFAHGPDPPRAFSPISRAVKPPGCVTFPALKSSAAT